MFAIALTRCWRCNWPLMTTWPHERPRVCGRPGDLGVFLFRSLPGSPHIGTWKITQPPPHQHVNIKYPLYWHLYSCFLTADTHRHAHTVSVSNFYRRKTLERGLFPFLFFKTEMSCERQGVIQKRFTRHAGRKRKTLRKKERNRGCHLFKTKRTCS